MLLYLGLPPVQPQDDVHDANQDDIPAPIRKPLMLPNIYKPVPQDKGSRRRTKSTAPKVPNLALSARQRAKEEAHISAEQRDEGGNSGIPPTDVHESDHGSAISSIETVIHTPIQIAEAEEEKPMLSSAAYEKQQTTTQTNRKREFEKRVFLRIAGHKKRMGRVREWREQIRQDVLFGS